MAGLIDSNFVTKDLCSYFRLAPGLTLIFTVDEYRELQLAGGLTSVASLSTVVDGFSEPRFKIPDLNVAAYVCDCLLEESTHQLIAFVLLCSSMHLCRADYSS